MTVASETSTAVRAWTGAEGVFTPGFTAQDAAHVKASYLPTGAVDSVALLAGVNFTVALSAAGDVSVTPLAMPPPPGNVTIWRDTPATQGVNFLNLAAYAPATHTKLHDASAMRDAELRRDVSQTISGTLPAFTAALAQAQISAASAAASAAAANANTIVAATAASVVQAAAGGLLNSPQQVMPANLRDEPLYPVMHSLYTYLDALARGPEAVWFDAMGGVVNFFLLRAGLNPEAPNWRRSAYAAGDPDGAVITITNGDAPSKAAGYIFADGSLQWIGGLRGPQFDADGGGVPWVNAGGDLMLSGTRERTLAFANGRVFRSAMLDNGCIAAARNTPGFGSQALRMSRGLVPYALPYTGDGGIVWIAGGRSLSTGSHGAPFAITATPGAQEAAFAWSRTYKFPKELRYLSISGGVGGPSDVRLGSSRSSFGSWVARNPADISGTESLRGVAGTSNVNGLTPSEAAALWMAARAKLLLAVVPRINMTVIGIGGSGIASLTTTLVDLTTSLTSWKAQELAAGRVITATAYQFEHGYEGGSVAGAAGQYQTDWTAHMAAVDAIFLTVFPDLPPPVKFGSQQSDFYTSNAIDGTMVAMAEDEAGRFAVTTPGYWIHAAGGGFTDFQHFNPLGYKMQGALTAETAASLLGGVTPVKAPRFTIGAINNAGGVKTCKLNWINCDGIVADTSVLSDPGMLGFTMTGNTLTGHTITGPAETTLTSAANFATGQTIDCALTGGGPPGGLAGMARSPLRDTRDAWTDDGLVVRRHVAHCRRTIP